MFRVPVRCKISPVVKGLKAHFVIHPEGQLWVQE